MNRGEQARGLARQGRGGMLKIAAIYDALDEVTGLLVGVKCL